MDKYILNREEVVLLIIDIQDRLVVAMKDKDEVIKNTILLLEAAGQMEIPVLVTEQYPKGLGSTVEELKAHLEKGKIFSKNSFTAYGGEVQQEMDRLGRRKIIIVGMESHVCVYQTTRDLLEAGYQVHIARDGVTSRTRDNYENALNLMGEMGAVISNSETIVFDLLKISGTPEFKYLSKLIK